MEAHSSKNYYISLVILLFMISEWFQRVGSSVPRGFSRYFILELLKTKAYTGKEIIDHAAEQSNGVWKPSPGLIYPLLGRLLDEGLIEEAKDGKYQLTKKGIETAADVDKINDIVRKQLDVLFRLGNVGRFVTMDLLEKMSSIGSILDSNFANMTSEETQKYRKFLEAELKKIDEKDIKKGKEIKIE
jgi:DNA-binding PadR family transcriptional regulator